MQKEVLKRISLAGVASVGALVAYAGTADAANLTSVMVKLDRMKTSTATGGTICVKQATASVADNVKVTFPTGFGVSGTAANWGVSVTNLPSGTVAWPGVNTATSVSGQTVTFPSSELTVGTEYCFNFTGTSTLTNPASAANSLVGTVAVASGVTTIDSSEYALAIIDNDQVVVSATVTPIFTFALGGNTDAFTTPLSPTAIVSTTGVTGTVATNADSGWVAWVKSANQGLSSASSGASIATAGTLNDAAQALTVGSNGYGLDVTFTDSGVGDGVVSQSANYGAEYDGTYTNATTATIGTLSNAFQPIAASTGTTNGDTVTLTERATISAVTPAATDYTDTLTVVAAGRF